MLGVSLNNAEWWSREGWTLIGSYYGVDKARIGEERKMWNNLNTPKEGVHLI